MKIECDKCGAKYSIADDKVRGKTFKIRCKKCSNVIIVRDKAGGADDGGDAPADEPGWHLAIGGETVGPISEAEVRERFAAGEIDKDTSVWQEGFEDWLPLSEVSAFSDLADRPASSGRPAAAPDPFAGGSDDDYSAPSTPAVSTSSDFGRPAEPARQPVAAAPSAAASSGPNASAAASGSGASPRVSALTGARNENSVLFSLDSLSSMAMGSKPSGGGGGGGPAPSGPSFSLGSGGGGGGGGAPAASPTGNSEGSGLIDIRAMSGMMGSGGGGGGGGGAEEGRDDSMLPSFGGTGFGGLSAAPLLVTPAQPVVDHAPAPEPQRSSNAPLYALMAILLLGMGGMAWYILTRPPPTPETKIVEVIKPAEVKDRPEDEDDGDKPKKKKKDEEVAEETGEAGDTPPATPDDKKGTVAKTTPKKTDKKGDKTDSKTGAVGDTPKTEPKKEEKKEEKKEDYSVDCILDPSKCGKKGGGDSGASKPPSDSSLPEKLELSDIQAGVNPVKANAKANCAKNAKGGEKVSIKLSISGPAGTVLSSTVVDAAGNDGLANCVAAELKKATFKKVQKEQIGTQVSVSF